MDFLKSLWRGNGGASQTVIMAENTENISDSAKSQKSSHEDTDSHPNSDKQWDPRAVEFFKDFPEPYRLKAIERFSKREGLHRFEVFREMAMSNELRSARKGIFLEDQREYEEWMHEQNRDQQRLAMEKEKELFRTRDIPLWEQKVLKVVPLQPGDKMWLKLALSANASVFGVAFLVKWGYFKQSVPKPPKVTLVRTFIGAVGVCGFMQLFAAYRLMDWGPFDRSVDERHFITKVAEDTRKELKLIQQYLEEKFS